MTKPSMYLSGASYAVYHTLPEASVQFDASPILDAKAMKNSVSPNGMSYVYGQSESVGISSSPSQFLFA